MRRNKNTGYYVLKYFVDRTDCTPVSHAELCLRMREHFSRKFSDMAIHNQLQILVEFKILKREAHGYSISHHVLRNCHEQFEQKRKDFF